MWQGGLKREGLAWLVVRALCLASCSTYTHYFMPSTLVHPTHSSRQHPNNQLLCFLYRIADCLWGPSQR